MDDETGKEKHTHWTRTMRVRPIAIAYYARERGRVMEAYRAVGSETKGGPCKPTASS